MKIYATKKIYAKNMLKETTEAVSLSKEWPETSPYQEQLALLRKSEDVLQPSKTVRENDWSELTKSAEVNPGWW